jgi:hypothetical protein|nr:MAG TPA: hypothetical protein [Caudoviricetes sp.]
MTTSTSKPTAEQNEDTRSVDVSGDEYTASGPYERETVITTSDGDELVTIETWQRGYLGKLRRDHRFTEKPGGTDAHGVFTIPRNRWTPTGGAKRSVKLTEEQKARVAERLKSARAKLPTSATDN